jgi:hypothetical protein
VSPSQHFVGITDFLSEDEWSSAMQLLRQNVDSSTVDVEGLPPHVPYMNGSWVAGTWMMLATTRSA